MAHLIDKSALLEEIKNLKKKYKECPTRNSYEEGVKNGRLIGYKDALHKINTIEVKDVNPTDDFIEKACEFINKANLYLYHCISEECDLVNTEKMIEDFKKYMKG